MRLRHCYGARFRAPLLCLPTGGGKTIIFTAIAVGARQKGKRTLIVVHRRELLQQAVRKLVAAGVSPGIIAPGETPDYAAMTQVGSIQTIVNRLHLLPEFDLIVFDEAHHARAGQWTRLIAAQPKARLLGVTATPCRLDGKGLGVDAGGCFDTLVVGAEVDELTELGFLAPAHCFVPEHRLDLRGVRTVAGEYHAGDLARAVHDARLTGDAVEQYRLRADHKSALAYCVSVSHAQEVADEFAAAGYRARMVSGKTPTKQRDAWIAGLGTGEVEVLCSCDLISEGLDIPSVAAVLLLRPTKSLVLHRQQIGRGMRPADGKEFLVVNDHVGACLTHGLPESRIPWSLDGIEKKAQPAPTWRCECGCLNPLGRLTCQECGADRPGHKPAPRAPITADDGGLAHLTAERLAEIRALNYYEFLATQPGEAELRAYAEIKGYRRGWVWHQLQERSAAERDRPQP